MLVDDLIVPEDLELVPFERLSMLVDFEGVQQVGTVHVWDHLEIMARYPDQLDLLFFAMVLDLNVIGPIVDFPDPLLGLFCLVD